MTIIFKLKLSFSWSYIYNVISLGGNFIYSLLLTMLSDNKIDFAGFLDIMHVHSQREKCQQEIMAAFQAHDRDENGTVEASELLHILTKFGEKLSSQEGNS